jgi:hypothetical protein
VSTRRSSILNQLLLLHTGRTRLWTALAVLAAGTFLLLLSVLAWSDFDLLIKGGGGSGTESYIVIGKQITERNMGTASANAFSASEIYKVRQAPQVLDAGEITPALFPVYAEVGGQLPLQTELPLASVPDRFLDAVPSYWNWQPGNPNLPVVLAARFLDIYNYVFAPGQGLPQLSRGSVQAIGMRMKAGSGSDVQVFSAHISGFSDRVGSVLVPQSFITYGNSRFAASDGPARVMQLILRVADPSHPQFVSWLQQHGYTTEPQGLQWSRMRAIVQSTAAVTGGLAILLMVAGALIFMLFIELSVTRSRSSLVLLHQLGYSRRYLVRFMVRRFLPLVAGSLLLALAGTVLVQVVVSTRLAAAQLQLSVFPGAVVWAAFAVCSVLVAATVYRAIVHSVGQTEE